MKVLCGPQSSVHRSVHRSAVIVRRPPRFRVQVVSQIKQLAPTSSFDINHNERWTAWLSMVTSITAGRNQLLPNPLRFCGWLQWFLGMWKMRGNAFNLSTKLGHFGERKATLVHKSAGETGVSQDFPRRIRACGHLIYKDRTWKRTLWHQCLLDSCQGFCILTALSSAPVLVFLSRQWSYGSLHVGDTHLPLLSLDQHLIISPMPDQSHHV